MGIRVYGTERRFAEFEVTAAGVEVKAGDEVMRYEVDPVEAGEVGLLALMGRDIGSRAWSGEGRLLRAYWFRRPVRPGVLEELAREVERGVGEDRVAARLRGLMRRFSARPVFCFSEEELRLEPVVGESSVDEGKGEAEAEGGRFRVWFFGRYELAELVRAAGCAARERLKGEGYRVIGGLGVVTEGEGGLGFAAGNAGVYRLSEEAVKGLRAFLLRVLDHERGGVYREGAFAAYVEGGRLARVLRDGGGFWDVGVVVEVAGRRVRLSSPAEVARLLVFLMD